MRMMATPARSFRQAPCALSLRTCELELAFPRLASDSQKDEHASPGVAGLSIELTEPCLRCTRLSGLKLRLLR